MGHGQLRTRSGGLRRSLRSWSAANTGDCLARLVQQLNPADTESELASPIVRPYAPLKLPGGHDDGSELQAVLPGRDGCRGIVHALDGGSVARVDCRIEPFQ